MNINLFLYLKRNLANDKFSVIQNTPNEIASSEKKTYVNRHIF